MARAAAVEAARAGKDIFLEKPLGLSVKDDIALGMREAVRGYDRVFQFGTQQRSDRNFGFACESWCRTGGSASSRGSSSRCRPAGPSAWFGPRLCRRGSTGTCGWGPPAGCPSQTGVIGNCGEWGHISNFSLGWITTWGIHHVDIAQWGTDSDNSGPVEVEGTGEFPAEGLYDCATAWDVTWKYANGVVVKFIDKSKRRQGVLFEGTDGWVFVERGGSSSSRRHRGGAQVAAAGAQSARRSGT